MTATLDVLEAARRYAQQYAIVAVRPDKKPWGNDPDGKGWRKHWKIEEIEARLRGPRCVAIGFLGGQLNHGIVPLDFDTEAGEKWWQKQCEAAGVDPDDFPTVITPGKIIDGQRIPGKHRYVTDVRGSLGNSEGELKPLGINVRGNGHAMLPPSPHPDGGNYLWLEFRSLDDYPDGIPACPAFIYAAIAARQPAQPKPNGAHPGAREHGWCMAAFSKVKQQLGTEKEPGRNNALNNAAMQLGHLAHFNVFTEDMARAALKAACTDNGLIAEGLDQFNATFDSGWKAGEAAPGKLPEDKPKGQQPAPAVATVPLDGLQTTCPADWVGEPPYLDWVVQGCFLRATVGMFSGDGGLGKSLLGQQLLTCAALGIPWLGMDTARSACLGIFCEDDYAELQRRQVAINKLYQCAPADLTGRLEYASLAGLDAVMADFDLKTNAAIILPLFDMIRAKALAMKAGIIFLDTLADVFGGNEINRAQARRFIHLLRRLAIECEALVLITAHPSLVGLNTGTGTSGSTGWNNSVRSRVYLTKPEGEAMDDERVLKTMKNNQGALGNEIRLRWTEGAFVAHVTDGAMDSVDRADLDGRLAERLRELVQAGSKIAADSINSNGFCNLIRKETGFKRYTQSEIINAQGRLLKAARIIKVELGPPSKRRAYLRPPDLRYPGEAPAPPDAAN